MPPATSAMQWLNPLLLCPGKFLLMKVLVREWLLICRDTLGFLQQDGLKLFRGHQRRWDGSLPSNVPQCHHPGLMSPCRSTPRHQPCRSELSPASPAPQRTGGRGSVESRAYPGGHYVAGLAAVRARAGISAEPNVQLSIKKCQKATSIPADRTQWERLSRSHLCRWGRAQPPACAQLWGFFFSREAYGKLDFFFKQL